MLFAHYLCAFFRNCFPCCILYWTACLYNNACIESNEQGPNVAVWCLGLNRHCPHCAGRQAGIELRLEVMSQILQGVDSRSGTRIWNLLAASCLLPLTSQGAFQVYWITLGRLNGTVKLHAAEAALGPLPSAAESSSTALPISITTSTSKFPGRK